MILCVSLATSFDVLEFLVDYIDHSSGHRHREVEVEILLLHNVSESDWSY